VTPQTALKEKWYTQGKTEKLYLERMLHKNKVFKTEVSNMVYI
jgi:hypothetical protein